MAGGSVHIGLVHYPVLDKQNRVVATSTVNYDLHDLARMAKTYGVESYYVITPLRSQILLIERLVEHWTRGSGAIYNPKRKEALELLRIQPSIATALEDLQRQSEGRFPVVLATTARRLLSAQSYAEVRRKLAMSDRPYLVLFGTGWGMAPEVMKMAEVLLEPIMGVGKYNHLSVRSAAAVVMDRLLG